MTLRLQIRQTVYRGESGHLICGKDARGRRVKVFVAGQRWRAEKAAVNIKLGFPIFEGL